MQFQPSKSELIHFQKRGNYQRSLQLGGSEIAPVDNVRLLGIWLDKRLCWMAGTSVPFEAKWHLKCLPSHVWRHRCGPLQQEDIVT